MQATRGKSRRRHSAQLKQEVVVACSQPEATVAGVARAFGLNANLVHQWRRGRGFRPVGGNLPVPCAPSGTTSEPALCGTGLTCDADSSGGRHSRRGAPRRS
ncbi:transposase [Comamonas odontotermitis]|uniref:transposase n=1 Tax=Comamonas odontotermitis TaxID=379895 RepID=UPI00366AC615